MVLSKQSVYLCVSAAVVCSIMVGCAAPKYIDLSQRSAIALVSFSLDQTINMENRDELDQGPGLLQKMVKGKEKANNDYFQYHQQALDGMWEQYKESIQDALLGIPMVGFDDIVGNEKLLALTKHKKKMVLGTDISIAARRLNPQGLNYISAYDSKLLDSLCGLLGTDLVLLVENEAQFDEVPAPIRSEAGTLVIQPTAKAYVMVTTTMYIHEKGNGLVAIEKFSMKSDEKMLVVWQNSNPENYPKLMMQANAKMFNEIKKRFLYNKEKLAEQKVAGKN